jgi:ketosteroid isomerase-like protein
MYKAMVQRTARHAFDQLNQGKYEPLLARLGPGFMHTFSGDHTLGGTRHTTEGMRRWFERLYRLFPHLHFEVHDVLVSGWPWGDTVVAIHWTDRAAPCDGRPYSNHGVHIMRLRRGRLVGLHAYLDTQRVAEVCQRLAAQGVAEAAMPPIED